MGHQLFISILLNINDFALADGFIFQDLGFNIEQKDDLTVLSAEMIGSPAKDKDLAVLVHITDIARAAPDPALLVRFKKLRGGYSIFILALHPGGREHTNFTVLAVGELFAGGEIEGTDRNTMQRIPYTHRFGNISSIV